MCSSDLQIANTNYSRARTLFVKADGTLNEDLVNKIRVKDKDGNWIVSGKLSLDDLPTNEAEIPAAIVGPTLVPAVPEDRMTASIVQNGWTFLGLGNSRMSRQPLVLNEIVNIRKQFKKSGFEQKWIENYQRGIDPTDVDRKSTRLNSSH